MPSNPSSTDTPIDQDAGPAADQVGRGDRRQRRTGAPIWATRSPGRSWSQNTGTTHDHRPDRLRPDGGCGDLPGHHPGAGRVHDVHGRRRATRSPRPMSTPGSSQHGDGDRSGPRTAVDVPSNPSSTARPRPTQAPALQLTKSAAVTDVNGNGLTDLGDTIAWSFLVKNTGTTTITGLAVADPTAGAVTCPVTTWRRARRRPARRRRARDHARPMSTPASCHNTATATGQDPQRRRCAVEPVLDRHPDRPGAGPAADQVGRR